MWTKQTAIDMAQADGLVLTSHHWLVINFIREYYEQHQEKPTLYDVAEGLSGALDTKGIVRAINCVTRLFPQGIKYQACRYAGIAYAGLSLEPASHVVLYGLTLFVIGAAIILLLPFLLRG